VVDRPLQPLAEAPKRFIRLIFFAVCRVETLWADTKKPNPTHQKPHRVCFLGGGEGISHLRKPLKNYPKVNAIFVSFTNNE